MCCCCGRNVLLLFWFIQAKACPVQAGLGASCLLTNRLPNMPQTPPTCAPAPQIVADLQRQEEQVVAALQHAGRGSELMGRARWWVDSRTQQQKAEAAEAQQREEERAAANAAADASREVQAAAHAAAVQAASRAETEDAAGGRAGRAAGRQAEDAGPNGSSEAAAGHTDEAASSSFQWQAVGRWAGRVSRDLRSDMGQVGAGWVW